MSTTNDLPVELNKLYKEIDCLKNKLEKKEYTETEKRILHWIGLIVENYYKSEESSLLTFNNAKRLTNMEINHIQYTAYFNCKGKVKIWLGRPGLFIGSKGELINHITEELSALLEKEIEISLIEKIF